MKLSEIVNDEVTQALQSPSHACDYAMKIGHRFPAGEKLIASESWSAYLYAKHIIKGRWLMGEDALAKGASAANANNYIELIKDPKDKDAFLKRWKAISNYYTPRGSSNYNSSNGST